MNKTPVIGIAGWKNSGKTTLVERLVTELTGRGFRVSTLKHAHHDADVDHEGTDSFRHRKAGASEVLLATSNRWAMMHELRDSQAPSQEELLEKFSPCDLILIEGFKNGPHPKIEVRRKDAKDQTSLPGSANIIAIASDEDVLEASIPAFHLDDIKGLADFIISTIKA